MIIEFNKEGYQLMSLEECSVYREMHGVSEDAWSDYSIPSGTGLVYELPNGELLLTPTATTTPYQGFVFKNKKAFNKCVREDFFPIDRQYMTWLEAHAAETKSFLEDSTFYATILSDVLNEKPPFRTLEEFERVFKKLKKYVRKGPFITAEQVIPIFCFGFAVVEYLVNVKQRKWTLRKLYTHYNPYYNLIVFDNDDNKEDVFGNTYSVLNRPMKRAFEIYCSWMALS